MFDISKFIIAILILIGSLSGLAQTLEVNGMIVKWEFSEEEDSILFQIEAPANGWMAIGLNSSEKLAGSNLIMINQKNAKGNIEDQFIERMGVHTDVEDLGGKNHTNLKSTFESHSLTKVSFKLSTIARDSYHFDLNKGKEMYLTLAFSSSDDFDHHSQMRTMTKIQL